MIPPLRLAIAGFGKIAQTRHLPAIAAEPGVALVAVADPKAAPSGLPHFASLEQLLREGPDIDAVALCTPPQMRSAQARIALAARTLPPRHQKLAVIWGSAADSESGRERNRKT